MTDSTVTTLDDPAPDAAAQAAAVTTKAGKAAKAAPAAPAAKLPAGAAEAGLTGDRVTITIHSGEGSAGREDVPVFVNGFGFQIKRGKPVEVPVEVVEVLRNAVTTQYENGEAIEVPRFAFSVHN